jgi:spore germination protein KC
MSAGRYLAGELPRRERTSWNCLERLFSWAIKWWETLTGDETRFFLMASGAFEHSYFAVPDPTIPGYIVVIDVTRERLPEVAVSFDGVNPKITLTVHLDGDLLSVQSRAQYEQSPLRTCWRPGSRQSSSRASRAFFDKVRPYGADIFGFGRYGNKNFKTIQQKEAYGWTRHFQDATLTTNVCFTIRRTGTQSRALPHTGRADQRGKLMRTLLMILTAWMLVYVLRSPSTHGGRQPIRRRRQRPMALAALVLMVYALFSGRFEL